MVLALMEMVVLLPACRQAGVCTGKVETITQERCRAEFSKSSVWALCQRLDPLVASWKGRDLTGACTGTRHTSIPSCWWMPWLSGCQRRAGSGSAAL